MTIYNAVKFFRSVFIIPLLIYINLFCSDIAMAQDKIVRNSLLTASPINCLVRRTEIKEIILEPSQKAGLHLHPCPVVGYIAEGTVLFQVKGGPLQTLKAGSAFYEPANTEILHFDNASNERPLRFICFYLINDEKQTIKMLPDQDDRSNGDH